MTDQRGFVVHGAPHLDEIERLLRAAGWDCAQMLTKNTGWAIYVPHWVRGETGWTIRTHEEATQFLEKYGDERR